MERRLKQLINAALDDSARTDLQKRLLRVDALSELVTIKQCAQHFGYGRGVPERSGGTRVVLVD